MIKIKSFPTRHNLFNSLYSIVQSSGTGRWQWPKLTKWWLKILQKYSTSSAWNVVSTSKSYWYPRYHKALNRTDIYINFLPSKVWALSPVLDCAWLQISKYKPASPCRDDSVAAPLNTTHATTATGEGGDVSSEIPCCRQLSCVQTTRGHHSYVISLLGSQQKLSHCFQPGHHGQDPECLPGKDCHLLLTTRLLVLTIRLCFRHHRQPASLRQQHKHRVRPQTPREDQPGSPSPPPPPPAARPQEVS